MTSTKSQVDPISHAVHLCIDMQNIFSKGWLWETPWMERVLPTIVTLTVKNNIRHGQTRAGSLGTNIMMPCFEAVVLSSRE
jgi:hypothetical protein